MFGHSALAGWCLTLRVCVQILNETTKSTRIGSAGAINRIIGHSIDLYCAKRLSSAIRNNQLSNFILPDMVFI